MPVLRQQSSDYNCGVFALEHLLQIHGKVVDIHVLEHLLKTDDKIGTIPDNIASYLEESYIDFTESYNSTISHLFNKFPCLVIYEYEKDDHYGVVVGHNETHLSIYNPASGTIDSMTFKDFEEKWHSKVYEGGMSANRWMLYLK